QIPDIASPRIHLLSNGTCSVMVTNSGGGYFRWLDLDVTRWRADTTCDLPGAVCYIRDLESGTIWSNTHQPVRSPERRYSWSFTPDKAEFRRRSGPCETFTEIVVSAEDDAEVRRMTLVNISRKSCRLELTTYLELALAPHRADRAHPAFSKLFIETEWLPHCGALLARRRLRPPDEQPIWAAHLIIPGSSSSTGTTATATRASRPSRGRSARALAAGHFRRPANRRPHDRSYPRHRSGARNFDRAHVLASAWVEGRSRAGERGTGQLRRTVDRRSAQAH